MMMIVLLTVEADSQTEVGQSRHEARLLHFLNSLLHYLTRLIAGRIPSLFQPLQRILDDNYANLRSLRSEVEAQGGRAAEVSEVLVAVAQAGWEGEGEGGQMILQMWDSLKWACWGRHLYDWRHRHDTPQQRLEELRRHWEGYEVQGHR